MSTITLSNTDSNLSDIDAYQDTTNNSNTVYQFLDNWGQATIFDRGGTDTLDFSSLSTGVTVNLLTRMASAGTSSVTWANGTTTFENVLGTHYADTIYGGNNGAGKSTLDGQGGDDTIYGGNGKDAILGGTGHDDLFGGSGEDSLTGSWGDDHMEGGADNDAYVFQHLADPVITGTPEPEVNPFIKAFAISLFQYQNGEIPAYDLSLLHGDGNDSNGGAFSYADDFIFNDKNENDVYDPTARPPENVNDGLTQQLHAYMDYLRNPGGAAMPTEFDVINDAQGLNDVLDFSALGSKTMFDSWQFTQDGNNLEILMNNGGHELVIENFFAADLDGNTIGGQGQIEVFHFADGDLGFADVMAHLS